MVNLDKPGPDRWYGYMAWVLIIEYPKKMIWRLKQKKAEGSFRLVKDTFVFYR